MPDCKSKGYPLGKVFGELKTISTRIRTGEKGKYKYHYVCLCSCGNITKVSLAHLMSYHTTSCGCKRVSACGDNFRKHGESTTKLFSVWRGIKSRCNNTNDSRYGGRGISLCDEWKHDFIAFKSWAINNGYNEYLTIDRINNNGNYEPNNCKWSTASEQSKNKRSTILITAFGETKCAIDWSVDSRCNVSYYCLKNRIKKGFKPEMALTLPRVINKREEKQNIATYKKNST